MIYILLSDGGYNGEQTFAGIFKSTDAMLEYVEQNAVKTWGKKSKIILDRDNKTFIEVFDIYRGSVGYYYFVYSLEELK